MKPIPLAPRIVALILGVSIATPSPPFALRQANPQESLPVQEKLRTGLEEPLAQVVKVMEEAASGGDVAVVEASALESAPVLQAVIGRLRRLSRRVILLGESPAALELVAARLEIPWARTPDELSDLTTPANFMPLPTSCGTRLASGPRCGATVPWWGNFA